jgi:hypothetical protein
MNSIEPVIPSADRMPDDRAVGEPRISPRDQAIDRPESPVSLDKGKKRYASYKRFRAAR